jgi:formate transporter
MWLPILTFFAPGYEHSIVNMFVIPAGKMLGAPITFGQWWFWNQIPVTLGNVFSGVFLTGLSLYFTFKPAQPTVEAATSGLTAPRETSLEQVPTIG